MDRRTNYFRLKKMLDSYPINKISFQELQALISIHIASTPKIIEQAMRTMGMTGLIKDMGNSHFEIIKENGNMQ